MNQDGADISLRDALAANSQVRSMAPAALALALELSRKWFRPLRQAAQPTDPTRL